MVFSHQINLYSFLIENLFPDYYHFQNIALHEKALPLCAALAAKEGLGEFDALKAITIDAAKICRVDNRLGSLEVGKDADFVIFEGSPFDIFSRVFVTIIDGKIVWQ